MASDPARTPRPIGRRVVSLLVTQLLVAVGLRVTVLAPERCPAPDGAALDAAIERTLTWFGANGEPDGRWLYRYHPAEDRAEGSYNLVRHAGTLVALEQAAAAGWTAAAPAAEHGWRYVEANLRPLGDGVVFVDEDVSGSTADAGAAALVSVAWTFRLARLGVPAGQEPAELVGLGRFLLGQIEANGAVAAFRGADGVVDPVRSRFYTGEVAWAMQRLAARRAATPVPPADAGASTPPQVWLEAAATTLRYVSTERDAAERWFPAIADHWAAYALADAVAPESLPPAAVPYRTTLAGRFAVQVRWESQRRPGRVWSSLTKGRPATGAAIGTLGEGLGALVRDAERRAEPDAAWRGGLHRQLGCAAGLLVERQVADAAAARYPSPARVRGAWVTSGVTQVDDQQHALSALLAYRAELSS